MPKPARSTTTKWQSSPGSTGRASSSPVFSAYSRVVDWAFFRTVADEVGAYLLVDMAHVAGLVAAGLYPSRCRSRTSPPHDHKTLRGPRGGLILAKSNRTWRRSCRRSSSPAPGRPAHARHRRQAVALKEAMEPEFVEYQRQVIANARAMAKVFMDRGYDVVSKGTDDHLFLVSFIGQGLTARTSTPGSAPPTSRSTRTPCRTTPSRPS